MEWIDPIRIEDYEEETSYSSMSMYNLDGDVEESDVPSNQSPTLVIHDAPLPVHMEEVHSSPIIEKVIFERYFVIHEEYHPSIYNIKEIFGSFTFNLCRKEVKVK